MSKVLVTGGLGFIGHALCRHLLETDPGIRLTIVDNLSGTLVDWSDLRSRAEIRIQDVRKLKPSYANYDDVFHLASPVGSVGILERAGSIASDIIEVAAHVADIAALSGARLTYLSSSEVYGRDGQHRENTELRVPVRHGAKMEYALGKLTAEHLFLNRSTAKDLNVRIVRPFNVIGTNQSQDLGFVVPTFFRAALSQQPMPVFGDGQQVRSFCDIRDLVEGLITVHHQGRSQEIYNVGNPHNLTTILELARTIRSICGSSADIECVDPVGVHGKMYLEAFNKIPDIDKVSAETGWHPRYPLEVTLDRIYRDMLGQPGFEPVANSRRSTGTLLGAV